MTKTYTCPYPGCDREFTSAERQGKNCPCGKVQIKLEQERKESGGGFIWVAKLEEGVKVPDLNARVPQTPVEILSAAYGTLCSVPGELPLVFLRGKEDKPEYTVIYVSTFVKNMYCPNPRCCKLMFMNTTIKSSLIQQSHKCRNRFCGADVTFIFTNNLMEIVRAVSPPVIEIAT